MEIGNDESRRKETNNKYKEEIMKKITKRCHKRGRRRKETKNKRRNCCMTEGEHIYKRDREISVKKDGRKKDIRRKEERKITHKRNY